MLRTFEKILKFCLEFIKCSCFHIYSTQTQKILNEIQKYISSEGIYIFYTKILSLELTEIHVQMTIP